MAVNVHAIVGSDFIGHDSFLVTSIGLLSTSSGAEEMSFGNLKERAGLLVSCTHETALN